MSSISPSESERPLFSTPVLWAIRVLSLLAVVVSSYLAYVSLGHSTVAGCGEMGPLDCEAVMGTPWSRWLGLPVAVGGLACYTGLFILSSILRRLSPRASRVAATLLVMLSVVAAGAGLWFVSLQLVVFKFCPYCIGVHLTGMTIAGLVLLSVLRYRLASPSRAQHVAVLAATLPMAAPKLPVQPGRPVGALSLPWALTGAGAVLAILIGGQLLAPAKTYEIEQVTLDESIDLSATPSFATVAQSTPSSTAQTHVVHRMPTDEEAEAESATGAPAEMPKPAVPEEKDVASASPDAEPEIKDSSPEINDPHVVPAQGIREVAAETNVEPAVETSQPPVAPNDSQPQEPKAAPAAEKPQPERKVSFLNDTLTVNVHDEAVIGSPDAPYVIVELMDYTCPHCRAAHEVLKKTLAKYGDQVAVVIMPVPLDGDCNKYVHQTGGPHSGGCKLARLALSVWKVKPTAFSRYHDWLLADKDHVPAASAAIIQAFDVVDGRRLRQLTESNEMTARIDRDIELFKKLSNGHSSFGLPVQIVGNKVLSGRTDAGKMSHTWEQELGVKPQ
jgi:uncharacterized membrane protein/protein-disulfide isomerase